MNFRSETNRRNAARSTGPRTSAGKARSRTNARRHGLSANRHPLDAIAAETRELSLAICGPDADPDERAQADIVADCEVLLRTIRNLEVMAYSGVSFEEVEPLNVLMEKAEMCRVELRRRGMLDPGLEKAHEQTKKTVELLHRLLNRLQPAFLTAARLQRYEKRVKARQMAAIRDLAKRAVEKKFKSPQAS